MNAGAIKRHSAAVLARRSARGQSRTNLARVRPKTAAELERDIAGYANFRDAPKN